jgi:ADP-ribose pyrophosphatase YjhB (NUDIX family)
MTPDELIARHGGVAVRRSNTVELARDRWESGRERAERGWGVGAFVKCDGRVLLVRHDDEWVLPGGMLEPGETHAEGAAREVSEETGIEIGIDGLIAISEQTFVNAADDRSFEFHFATFRGIPRDRGLSDDPGIADELIHEVAWHGEIPADTFDRELVVELRDRS